LCVPFVMNPHRYKR